MSAIIRPAEAARNSLGETDRMFSGVVLRTNCDFGARQSLISVKALYGKTRPMPLGRKSTCSRHLMRSGGNRLHLSPTPDPSTMLGRGGGKGPLWVKKYHLQPSPAGVDASSRHCG
jgi:hypothetical protein